MCTLVHKNTEGDKIITHYIIKPPCVHFDIAYLQQCLPGIEHCNNNNNNVFYIALVSSNLLNSACLNMK